jgi:RNA polymerase sigma-70 factor (ECF subfamily)
MQSPRRPDPPKKPIDADHELDRQLAQLVLAGDESAFPKIYDAYYRRVFAFVRKRVGDMAEAEDLTQETFVQVYRSLGSFQGRSSLRSWTFGIAHNVCLRFYRHCSRWMVGPKDARELWDAPVDSAIERTVDAARVLDKCDEVLSANRRPAHLAIFQLRYGESRKIKSIASELGKSKEAVKMSLRKSREVLTDRVPELPVVLEGAAHFA